MTGKNPISIPDRRTETVLLQAEPEPLEIELSRTAVMVIDMQNAWATSGGMIDLWGWDISGFRQCIEPIKKITNSARDAGCRVINVAVVQSPDMSDTGGPNSPYWYKLVLSGYREHPEWRDKMLFRGTWGAAIIDELKPPEGEIVVEKPFYSAFVDTNLDTILKSFDIKYLIFTGIATNICVETTIRDAHQLGYFPILVSDASKNEGKDLLQEATILNVRSCFGWISTTEKVIEAIRSDKK